MSSRPFLLKEVENKMEELINTHGTAVLIAVVMLIMAVYKYGPRAWSAFNFARKKVNYTEEIIDMVKKHEGEIYGKKGINEKLDRDYERLNDMDKILKRHAEEARESREEMQIIIESLLGILKGLQEIGANGPTKEAQKKIEDYMIEKSHETRDI